MAKQTQKKAGKGSPKLRRCSKHEAKYKAQFRRTFRNKLRRVRECNGPEAAEGYSREFGV